MTDIEWVEESDWDAVGVGQRVTLKNDDGIVSFKILRHHRTRDCIHIFSNGHSYSEWDWTLFVEAKPAVELPTERGWYVDVDGDLWDFDGSLWWRESESYEKIQAVRYVPFTRLEPVAETAKKVLDWAWQNDFVTLGNVQDGYKKFGVPE